MRVGVLHTVPALVPLFHTLLTERRDDLDIVHTADPSLLSRAVAGGITDDVGDDIRRHLVALRDAGAAAVLVTCSSIGEAAAHAAHELGLDLMRVDTAMAREAVERARAGDGRILVLATLPATLGPTTRLVESAAADAPVAVTARLVEVAADARADGDQARHDALIAAAIAGAGDADVVVLAQASMASGAGEDPRVLTSPQSGAIAFASRLDPQRPAQPRP